MKRFTFGLGFGGLFKNGFGMGRSGSKISKPIEFPAEMKLPLSDKRSCPYALTGIVVHVGGSSDSGHYTAYVKKVGKSGENRWYHIDDSFVEAVPEKIALRQRDAYLLFYCRKEVKLEFPSPPPRSMSAKEATEHSRVKARARANSLTEGDDKSTKKVENIHDKSGKVTHDKAKHPNLEKKLEFRMSDGNHRSMQPRDHKSEQSTNKNLVASDKKSSEDSSSSSSSDNDSETSSSDSRDKVLGSKKSPTSGAAHDGGHSDSSSSSSSSDDSDDSSDSDSTSSDSSLSKSNAGPKQPETPIQSPSIPKPSSGHEIVSSSKSDSGPNTTQNSNTLKFTPEKKKRKVEQTRVVMDRGSGREKISVMLGPRHKQNKAWTPQSSGTSKLDEGYELLGNRTVGKWDDDTDMAQGDTAVNALQARTQVVRKMEKESRSRKRKMHLDRWDASLDRGRVRLFLMFFFTILFIVANKAS